MQLRLLVDAGGMKPGPAVSQKLGPLGLNVGKLISEVNKATSDFKGIKVPVVVDIDTKTKEFDIKVLTPPTAELLKKEFNLSKGSSQPNKIKVANASIEQIIKVAKVKKKDMLIDELKTAVKSVLGSCNSLGILVENKNPKEIIREVDEGAFNDLISKGIEETSDEKRKELDSYFKEIQKEQEVLIKELEKKEAEEVAAKAQAATPTAEAETEKKEEKKVSKKK